MILLGAGLEGGFENTTELKVMNFKEATKGEKQDNWIKEVGNKKSWFDWFNL